MQKNGLLNNDSPKDNKMEKKKRKERLHELYIELVKMQKEIIASNIRLLVVFEGRMRLVRTEPLKESSNISVHAKQEL